MFEDKIKNTFPKECGYTDCLFKGEVCLFCMSFLLHVDRRLVEIRPERRIKDRRRYVRKYV